MLGSRTHGTRVQGLGLRVEPPYRGVYREVLGGALGV